MAHRPIDMCVFLVSCWAEIPPTGNNDQNQVTEEQTDQPTEENRPIVRLRGLVANPTDKPSDEGGDSSSRHRIDARSHQDKYSHISVVYEVFFCDSAY